MIGEVYSSDFGASYTRPTCKKCPGNHHTKPSYSSHARLVHVGVFYPQQPTIRSGMGDEPDLKPSTSSAVDFTILCIMRIMRVACLSRPFAWLQKRLASILSIRNGLQASSAQFINIFFDPLLIKNAPILSAQTSQYHTGRVHCSILGSDRLHVASIQSATGKIKSTSLPTLYSDKKLPIVVLLAYTSVFACIRQRFDIQFVAPLNSVCICCNA